MRKKDSKQIPRWESNANVPGARYVRACPRFPRRQARRIRLQPNEIDDCQVFGSIQSKNIVI